VYAVVRLQFVVKPCRIIQAKFPSCYLHRNEGAGGKALHVFRTAEISLNTFGE
jgi:hypothetical protein